MKIKEFEKLFNDVKEEYKIDSDLNIWVGDNPLKRPLLYGIKEVVPVFHNKKLQGISIEIDTVSIEKYLR
jgi:hypothetical protein